MRRVEKLSEEEVERITGAKGYKFKFIFNDKATKTCEEVVEEIFIKFLKANNIKLID
ncbi:MAG: hypothetical protein LBK29_03310 [Oscillospiraceae bacterium]|nr:hypothetical protein [Oscillospiraceae bacterium]